MEDTRNIKANLIEIEADDIREFQVQKEHFEDAVHIKLVLDGDEVLSKNKTGELGLLNEYMMEQNIVLNLMSIQYTDTLVKNLEMINNLSSKSQESFEDMLRAYRDDARKQLKEAGYEDYENCAYALDPYIGGSANMFLNETKDSYVRTRLTELLRGHSNEIVPGKNHIFEIVVSV